jgi:VanZ family protein
MIVYASSVPDQALWGGGSQMEKIICNFAHIPAYGVLMFLWLKAFDKNNRGQSISINVMIVIGMLLFAISDESHQLFVPGRTASLFDIALDVLGSFLGLTIFHYQKLGRASDRSITAL